MTFFLISFGSALGLVGIYWRKHLHMEQKGSWAKQMLQRLHLKRQAGKPAASQVEMLLLTADQQQEMKNLFMSAEAFFENGDLDEAEKLYIQVLSLDEAHLDANMRLGLIYLKKQLSKKAEAMFRKILGIAPADTLALSNLAYALYLQRNYLEAKEIYLQALELDPTRAARYINLAQVYRELKEYEAAIQAVHKAFNLDPQHNGYRLLLAEIYSDIGRHQDARMIVQNILKHESEDTSLRRTARVLLKKIDNAVNTLSAESAE